MRVLTPLRVRFLRCGRSVAWQYVHLSNRGRNAFTDLALCVSPHVYVRTLLFTLASKCVRHFRLPCMSGQCALILTSRGRCVLGLWAFWDQCTGGILSPPTPTPVGLNLERAVLVYRYPLCRVHRATNARVTHLNSVWVLCDVV